VTIRHWREYDGPQLLPMILDCLRANAEAGADMLPTEKNAGALWAFGLRAALRGDPCLVAVAAEGDVLGYTEWADLGNPLGLDYKARILAGLGTYVVPSHRRFGVSHLLRDAAESMGHLLGFGKVVGVAYHEAGLASVLARGYTVTGTAVEKVLRPC